jgi:hypothetical protein
MALMFFPISSLLESIVSNLYFPHTSLKAACASCVIAKLNFSTFSIAWVVYFKKHNPINTTRHIIFGHYLRHYINCYNSYIYNLYCFNKWN